VTIKKLLVANRGEIARRVFRTCRSLGISTVAVFSDADASAPFVTEADEAVHLPGNAPSETYLRGNLLIAAALATGADAIHPGYGFLSENAGFAQAVLDAGLTWLGPPPAAIETMGSKLRSKELMAAAGVPCLPSWTSPGDASGFPLLVKASAGGGGRGMRIVRAPSELDEAFEGAQREALSAFGDGTVFLERYVERPRHIEVQVAADTYGNTVALFERDCSIQRRHQKVIEEAPSPAVSPALRAALSEAAVAAAKAVDYEGVGTVEFVLEESGAFFFLEMNTRLQVEHPVTELVAGLDLVEQQLRIAGGLDPSEDLSAVTATGHAIELRVYAEDPKRFLPSPGVIREWQEPVMEGIRVDSGYGPGDEVTQHYDPLLAKLCSWGADRDEALARAQEAVAGFVVEGPKTNLPFFSELLDHPDFRSGHYDTGLVASMR